MFLKRLISYPCMAVLVFAGLLPMTPAFAVAPYEVATYSATNICQSGATLNGYVNPFFTTDTMRWFEWGTSQDYLPNQTNQSRNGNNTEYFGQDIFNLAPNTTYYFRVAAQNSKGAAHGEVFSFKTEGGVCPTPSTVNTVSDTGGAGAVYASQSVITKLATDIADTGARLNAVALPVGFTQTYGWFEWGVTPDFGQTTARRFIGSGTSILWNETISGLTPGTTYFFKPVIENQNGVSEGVLFSFHTTGTSPVIPIIVSHTSGQMASAAQSLSPKIQPKPTILSSAKKDDKTIEVVVVPSTDTAAPKERISETVQFENTTGAALKEATVRVVLPCDAEYVPAGGGDLFLQTGKMLTHRVGDVKPGEKINLLFHMDIGANTADKTPIETIAVVNWENKAPLVYTQSVGHAVITIDKNRITKGGVAVAGAAKSTNSFFPASIQDWGAVIGTLFLLFAVYMVFLVMQGREKERGVEEGEYSFGEDVPAHPALSRAGVSGGNHTKDPFVSGGVNIQKSKTVTTAVPVKKAITEKGTPPENLPV